MARRVRQSVGDQLPSASEAYRETVRRTHGLGVAHRASSDGGRDRRRALRSSRPVMRGPRVSFNRPGHAASPRRVRLDSLRRRARHQAGDRHDRARRRHGDLRRRRAPLAVDPTRAADRSRCWPPSPSSSAARTDDLADHVSMMIAPLPTNEADPRRRLASAHEAMRIAKERHDAVPANLIQDMTRYAPPAVAGLAARLVGAIPIDEMASPPFNLTISNVPGPRHAVYCGRPSPGRQLPAVGHQRRRRPPHLARHLRRRAPPRRGDLPRCAAEPVGAGGRHRGVVPRTASSRGRRDRCVGRPRTWREDHDRRDRGRCDGSGARRCTSPDRNPDTVLLATKWDDLVVDAWHAGRVHPVLGVAHPALPVPALRRTGTPISARADIVVVAVSTEGLRPVLAEAIPPATSRRHLGRGHEGLAARHVGVTDRGRVGPAGQRRPRRVARGSRPRAGDRRGRTDGARLRRPRSTRTTQSVARQLRGPLAGHGRDRRRGRRRDRRGVQERRGRRPRDV